MTQPRSPAPSAAAAAAALDGVLVSAFVLIGRSSHAEGVSLVGTFVTAWPFLVALALGWTAFAAWRGPRRLLWSGVGVWLTTVAGGLALRALSGQGVQPSFAIVTALVLAVFLLGWRAAAIPIARRRSRVA